MWPPWNQQFARLENEFPCGMAYFQGLWLLVSGRVDLFPDLNSLPFSFSILCFVNWFSRDMEPYFETCPFSKELTNKKRPSHPFKKYPLHFFVYGKDFVTLEGAHHEVFPWKLMNVFLKIDFVGSDYSFPFEMVPWKSLYHHFLIGLFSSFTIILGGVKISIQKVSLTFSKMVGWLF